MKKTLLQFIFIALLASLSALNYNIFVLPNKFAPSGIDGICVMIEYLTNTNIGYLSLIFNAPLIIASFFLLKREFTFKTLVYICAFSLSSVLFEIIDVSSFAYYTESGTSIVLAPVAAGVIRGILYAFTLKVNASSGGVDIIAGIVRKYKPNYNFMSLVFALNFCIAIISYFVYGFIIEPVICSIIYSFITSHTSKLIESNSKARVRFEIISRDSHKIVSEIAESLNKTATIIEAKGGYSGADTNMVVCAIEAKNVYKLEKILEKYPNAVCFESVISESLHLYY